MARRSIGRHGLIHVYVSPISCHDRCADQALYRDSSIGVRGYRDGESPKGIDGEIQRRGSFTLCANLEAQTADRPLRHVNS